MPMSTAVSAALLLCGAALTSTANPAKTVTDDTTAEAGAPKMCDVRRHGARGDNSTDDTAAFVAAIAACSGAAPTGRGVVVAPAPGTYLLKPLELKDNVELQILAGATLVLWPFGPNYRGLPACGALDRLLRDRQMAIFAWFAAHARA